MILSNGKPIERTHSEPLAIYISGGITGVENWQDIFMAAEQDLMLHLHARFFIFNPVNIAKDLERSFKVNIGKAPGYTDYMREDIKILARCNAICMLPGWKRSKGARLEYRIAKILNMQILEFQPE